MKVAAITLALAIAASASAIALDFACFGVAYLAEEVEDPEALVAQTYEQLFESLGGKVSPATLQKMIDAQDPYVIPDQAGTDLASLRQRVRELHEMLGKRKWENPGMRSALLARLSARHRGQAEQAAKIQTVIRETERGHMIHLPSATSAQVSPDGRYLTTMMVVGKGQGRLVSYDLKTRQRIEGTSPYSGGQILFSADGRHLLFDRTGQEDHGQTYRVPFNAGNPQWETAERIGFVDNRDQVKGMLADPDGQRFYSRYWKVPGGMVTFVATAQGGPSQRLDLPDTGNAFEWGATPNKDGLWFLHDGTYGLGVTHHTVDATGKTSLAAVWSFQSQNLSHALWAHDGKSLMGYGREGASGIELVTAARPNFEGTPPPVQRLELPKDASGQPAQIFDAKVHPKENRAAFLVNDKSNKRRLVWYDLKTGRELGDTPIPEKSFIRLAMDPSGAHFVLSSPEGHVYVGNLAPVAP